MPTFDVTAQGKEIGRMARDIANKYILPQYVEDIAQEGMAKLVEVTKTGQLASWDEEGRVIVYSAMRDYAKKERRRQHGGLSAEMLDTGMPTERFGPTLRFSTTQALELVAKLPEPDRSVVVWTAVNEPQSAIAAAIGVSQQHVGRILHRAYDTLSRAALAL